MNMTKRNTLQEIMEKRDRSTSSDHLGSYNERIDKIDAGYRFLLEQTAPDATSCNKEFSRYFPVAFVASIEGYVKYTISRLIDAGSPFLNRAASLHNVKLSIATVAAIQKKDFSLGEYIAHFLSISSLDDINRAMSILLDMDFLDHLTSSEFALFADGPLTLQNHRSDFISAVNDLFSMRHLLCHEFAEDVVLDHADILRFRTCTDILIALSDVVVQVAIEHANEKT